jgi:hypothetical protein
VGPDVAIRAAPRRGDDEKRQERARYRDRIPAWPLRCFQPDGDGERSTIMIRKLVGDRGEGFIHEIGELDEGKRQLRLDIPRGQHGEPAAPPASIAAR